MNPNAKIVVSCHNWFFFNALQQKCFDLGYENGMGGKELFYKTQEKQLIERREFLLIVDCGRILYGTPNTDYLKKCQIFDILKDYDEILHILEKKQVIINGHPVTEIDSLQPIGVGNGISIRLDPHVGSYNSLFISDDQILELAKLRNLIK